MKTPMRIIVNGASGKMGQEVIKAVEQEHDLLLVAQLTRRDQLAKAIVETQADIVVDFTSPACVFENANTIIEHNVHPIIGTTGLLPDQIKQLQERCEKKKLGGIIAPNFSIGVVLMMLFAKQASAFFSQCEIIEMHHAQKKDAPSGTALKTAEFINYQENPTSQETTEIIKGARGALHHHIPIHSVRLPGLLAHQEILFGAQNELLTLRHDTFHRAAFMPGVLLSIRKVMKLSKLVYGLEHIINNDGRSESP